jgi:hypothetical protein
VPPARTASRRLAPLRSLRAGLGLAASFCYGPLRMPERAPSLFERVPRGLFAPLGDPYAELYWELLAELYRLEFEREPFVVTRPTAIDVAEASIRSSGLWRERRQDLEALASQDVGVPREPKGMRADGAPFTPGERSASVVDPEVIDEAAAIRSLARRLVARLEESGWMHFQYRAGVGETMSRCAWRPRRTEATSRSASCANDWFMPESQSRSCRHAHSVKPCAGSRVIRWWAWAAVSKQTMMP